MIFARKVWHVLVAIKDGLVLILLLLFFLALYGLLTTRPSAGQMRDGALLLKLDGAVVEEPADVDPLEELVSSTAPVKEHRTRDVVRALRLAVHDDRIKAVVLDLSRFAGGGQVSMQEIGAAMDAVRAAKKPVLTYAVGYADDGVLLAAHASEVWVDPLGGAFITGPGGYRLYYGGLLQRFKVNAHLFKVGTFKDYAEPYIRSDQSDASKEARQALYAGLWENWKADVAKARPKLNIAMVTGDPVGWLTAAGGDGAKAAQAAGMVDRIGDRVAFGTRVREIVGEDSADTRPGSFARNDMDTMLAAHPESDEGDSVAVVTIAGEIVDGKAGPGTAGGDRIARLIDQATEDEAPALVLRVDSPGGSVFASERIRTAIERFKTSGEKGKAKPVVVSMANMAASGGYWVSTPAERIFAEPATVTGSIGIFAFLPSFEKTLADYGVTGDGVRTTPLSGQPDPISGLTPEVEKMLQANIENGYARFIGLVGKSRGKTPEQVDAIAQGRVWDGGTARQNGLVDQFGGLDDALAYAARRAGLGESWHAQYYGQSDDRYASVLERLMAGGDEDDGEDSAASGDLVAMAADRQQALLRRAFADLTRMAEIRGAQAYCLDCPVPLARAAAPRRDSGLLLSLGSWLRGG